MILARVFVYGNAQAYALTELKVDQVFAHGAAEDPATRAMLKSSIKLGRFFSSNEVVEGIEIKADYELAAALGCDEIQGYFIAKPMPPDEFVKWLSEYEKINHRH